MTNERPTRGVFIVWDEEDVSLERRDAGTVRDRTVVTGRWTVPKYVLWTNAVAEENIEAAERYAESIKDQHDNVRVEVFDGKVTTRR
jgi:hypothetical protein